jgi:hypothetical protein
MRSDHVYIGKIKYRSVSNYCKLIANCEPSKAKRTRLIVNKFISKRSEHVYVKNFKKQSEAKWFIFKFTNIYSYLTNTATFTCKKNTLYICIVYLLYNAGNHAPLHHKSCIRMVKREAEALLSLNPSCTL